MDRRRHTRIEASESVTVNPTAEPWNSISATIIDFSSRGIGLITEAPIAISQNVVINCRGGFLLGEVRVCEQVDERQFRVGVAIEFIPACTNLLRELRDKYARDEAPAGEPITSDPAARCSTGSQTESLHRQ